jgi:hypothetical protein
VAQKRSRTVERTASNRHPLKTHVRLPRTGPIPAQLGQHTVSYARFGVAVKRAGLGHEVPLATFDIGAGRATTFHGLASVSYAVLISRRLHSLHRYLMRFVKSHASSWLCPRPWLPTLVACRCNPGL